MQTMAGSKVLCAKFGGYTRNVFASGDDKNNVQIWRVGRDKPQLVSVLCEHSRTPRRPSTTRP